MWEVTIPQYEQVEMAFYKWLQMQEPDFYQNSITEHGLGNYAEILVILQHNLWETFNTVMTSCLTFKSQGTLHVENPSYVVLLPEDRLFSTHTGTVWVIFTTNRPKYSLIDIITNIHLNADTHVGLIQTSHDLVAPPNAKSQMPPSQRNVPAKF